MPFGRRRGKKNTKCSYIIIIHRPGGMCCTRRSLLNEFLFIPKTFSKHILLLRAHTKGNNLLSLLYYVMHCIIMPYKKKKNCFSLIFLRSLYTPLLFSLFYLVSFFLLGLFHRLNKTFTWWHSTFPNTNAYFFYTISKWLYRFGRSILFFRLNSLLVLKLKKIEELLH